jgi:DNA-binding NarL/FixJ family response regulator
VIARPKALRVLPCIDSNVRTPSIAVLRSTVGVDLLSFAPASTLVYRALSDEPDAIVIATEDLGTVAWQNDSDLIDVLSSTPTVLLSGRMHALLRKRAAALHIRSILPLQVTSFQLLAAIQATVAGLAVALEPFGQTEDADTASNRTDGIGVAGGLVDHLTARETVVLRLMALGLGNKEIASRLDISDHTAKFHVSSILAKLGASSRTEAVTIGMTRGLVAI